MQLTFLESVLFELALDPQVELSNTHNLDIDHVASKIVSPSTDLSFEKFYHGMDVAFAVQLDTELCTSDNRVRSLNLLMHYLYSQRLNSILFFIIIGKALSPFPLNSYTIVFRIHEHQV